MEDLNNFSEEQEDDGRQKIGYMTDSELSQKILDEEIKELVKKSVERKVKRRTTNKRKRNNVRGFACDGDGSQDDNKSYIRFSFSYMYSVFKAIGTSNHRKQLVKNMGFQYILELDHCYVPRAFAQWISDRIVPDEEMIRIGEKSIPLDPTAFVDVLGIPAGKLPVENDEEAGKYCFLELFGLSDVPNIKFFGDRITQDKDLADDEFCRCFMSVLLNTFLCPNSCTRPSTKYMGALVEVDKIKEQNWAKFAHDWFISSVGKYQKERTKHVKHTITLGGCIYQSAVRYLDFADFGSIKMPNTMPRVCVWKGKLLEHFSEMNKDSDGKYGANNIKDFSHTCYGAAARLSTNMRSNHTMFKDQIDKIVGEFLSKEVKNDIFNAFQSHMIDADLESYSTAQTMVLDFLKVITPQCINATNSDTTEYMQSQDSTHENEIHEGSNHAKRNCTNEAEQFLQSDACMEQPMLEQMSVTNVNRNDESVEIQHLLRTEGPEQRIFSSSPRERSFSLNHTPSDDDAPASISRPRSPPHEPNGTAEHVNTVPNSGTFRIEEPTLAWNAQQNADNASTSQNNNARREFLLEALKKYHWNDPSIPSFRIFEFNDDSGNYIEEEELWRPLGYTEEQYMERIFGHYNESVQELHTQNSRKANIQTEPNSSYVYSATKETTPSYKANPSSDFEFSSIQCAQRQRSLPLQQQSADIQNFIDLDPSQPSQHFSPNEQAPRMNIAGRKIFHDCLGDSPSERNQKLKEPMTPGLQFLWEKPNTSNTESPEVQCLGERMGKPNAESPGCVFLGESMSKNANSFMSEDTDSLYNARLTLGSSSRSLGKENVPPKRLVKPSHLISSPFELNSSNSSSISVTHKEKEICETITTLANDPDYAEWIINMNNCKVSLFQLGTLARDKGWVDAYVINANCRILFRDKHPRFSKKHFFFHTASDYFLQKWKNEYAKNSMHEKVLTNFRKADSARKLHLSDRLTLKLAISCSWTRHSEKLANFTRM